MVPRYKRRVKLHFKVEYFKTNSKRYLLKWSIWVKWSWLESKQIMVLRENKQLWYSFQFPPKGTVFFPDPSSTLFTTVNYHPPLVLLVNNNCTLLHVIIKRRRAHIVSLSTHPSHLSHKSTLSMRPSKRTHCFPASKTFCK